MLKPPSERALPVSEGLGKGASSPASADGWHRFVVPAKLDSSDLEISFETRRRNEREGVVMVDRLMLLVAAE